MASGRTDHSANQSPLGDLIVDLYGKLLTYFIRALQPSISFGLLQKTS